MRLKLFAGCLAIGLCSLALRAQNAPAPPTTPTGAISGVVLDGVTKQPIEGALVLLVASGGDGPPINRPRQRTDARGRFIFHRLPPLDMYGLQVTRQGYFDAGFRSAPGTSTSRRIAVREGEWVTNADVLLWKPAAISGTIRDERGEPMVGVAVRAISQIPVAGRSRLAAGATTLTDDRGVYRLANLKPGRHFIHVPSVQVTLPDGTAPLPGSRQPQLGSTSSAPVTPEPLTLLRSDDAGRNDGLGVLLGPFPAPPPGNAASAYPMMYHPAARALDQAETVSLTFGEHRRNVDVTLSLVPTVRVSGQVTGPAEVIGKLPVRLMPTGSEDLGEGAEAAVTLTDALGRFTFLQVPSGTFTVIASGGQSEYATATSSGLGGVPTLPGFAAVSSSSGFVAGSDGLRFTTRRTSQSAVVGRVPITVTDQNVDRLVVPVQAGVAVSGRFLWDGSQAPPNGVRVPTLVKLEPADGDLSLGMPLGRGTAAPATDGASTSATFVIPGVLPGRYVFGDLSFAEPYVIQAIDHAGVDLLTTPLVVSGDRDLADIVFHLTKKPLSVSGTVVTTNGALPQEAAVIIFPAERALWRDYGITAPRFKTATVTSSGSYLAPAGLVPGEYFAVAVPQNDRNRWTEPEFLTALAARATRFRLTPGVPATVDLRIDGGAR